ncbi:MAG: 16S rRNA processing protein RimM [Candidatus Riflebacteria bacterium]|nr:16S rRNA processing protein RimM [Candidatus Riflebacteria bacterium]
MSSGFVAIGKVVGAHGIRGELKLECYLDEPGQVLEFDELHFAATDKDAQQSFAVEAVRLHKQHALLSLAGIDTRNAAEGLIGREASVPQDRLPEVPPGSFKLRHLIGLRVLDPEGQQQGTVGDVELLAGRGVVQVVLSAGGQVLVPFVGEYVRQVDIEGSALWVTEAFERLLSPEEVGR